MNYFKNKIIITFAMIIFLFAMSSLFRKNIAEKKVDENIEIFENVKVALNENFKTQGLEWKDKIEIDDKTYEIDYTFDKNFEKKIIEELKRYSTAHTSIVVLDNSNGDILAAIDYDGIQKIFSRQLSFSNTNPAASLFKIVTAAKLIEEGAMDPETEIEFKGRSTTLYRYQLKEPKNWKRKISFEKAFARSNNVVFGRAAIENLSAIGVYDMAEKFGFNQDLLLEFSNSISKFPLPENDYNLAELASGFNTDTLISPVHAAVLGSIIANNGIMIRPHLIKSIKEVGKLTWEYQKRESKVLSKKTAEKIQQMMELTVIKGTARRMSRGLPRRIKDNIILGAKTGSITGGVPFGKRDWVVVYAKPQDSSMKSISVAIMLVNQKKWYIKSSVLAKKIIEYYYNQELNG